MVSNLFHLFFYNPIYNLLVFWVGLIPGGDVGLAIIAVTLIVKFILLPLSIAASKTQREMKRIEPLLAELKKKYPDKQEQAAKTLLLYREHHINPFAGIATLFLQIPILLALYWVFIYQAFPTLDPVLLYSFTPHPGAVSLSFLGLVLVTGHSAVLAVIAAATQYVQAHIMATQLTPPVQGEKGSFQTDFAHAMQVQMKYILPIIIGVISYTSGAIALYFITSNLVGAFQEYFVLRKVRNKVAAGSRQQAV